ncbi:MAG: prepilin-type N-terminal cleavage/methylation domain-containing protein [Sulfurovum sp.]|nr:prepilin-type N-terminal cleavage/methylation domain-containing protein [Sulfurovum sp.]
MKQINTLRAAFSMVELVFVIVILGIVSSIGSEVIAKVYEGYIVQRGQYRASIKTELALNQIANRLRYAIPGTVGFRPNKGATFELITETNSANDKVLQWVAYDGDSFESKDSTSGKPGWSGFCDLNASSSTTINTPGSDLGLASSIIGNLGGSIANARIYFPYDTSYGVSTGSAETITLDTALSSGEFLYERYKLAWTSYALEVDAIGDLYLHYNFAPIVGQTIAGSSSLLLKNVTNFRFKGSEGSLRIKICKEEKIGSGLTDTVQSCKERVIF